MYTFTIHVARGKGLAFSNKGTRRMNSGGEFLDVRANQLGNAPAAILGQGMCALQDAERHKGAIFSDDNKKRNIGKHGRIKTTGMSGEQRGQLLNKSGSSGYSYTERQGKIKYTKN